MTEGRRTSPGASDLFEHLQTTGADVVSEARSRVERIRKGDFSVELVGADGRPFTGNVRLRLQRHEFRFGANIHCQWRDHLSDRPDLVAKGLEVVAELFNTGVLLQHWKFSQQSPDAAFDFTRAEEDYAWMGRHGIEPRWHSLVYNNPNGMVPWCSQVTSTDEWWRRIEAFLAAVGEHWSGRCAEYDLMNEMNFRRDWVATNNPAFPVVWDPDVGERIFRTARKHLPEARLALLNYWALGDPESENYRFNLEYYRQMKRRGAPVDLFATQGHHDYGMSPESLRLDRISDGFDELGEIGPVAVTEFNSLCRNKGRDDPKLMTDEQAAQWTVEFYTLVFSKPYVTGLTHWFVFDQLSGDKLDAGLLTLDGEEKAECRALRELLTRQWRTDWRGPAGHDGIVRFRGFFATYDVIIGGRRCGGIGLLADGPRSVRVQVEP